MVSVVAVAAARAYWVTKNTGQDSRGCVDRNDDSAAMQTIARGLQCLSAANGQPGDTLYIRGGDYRPETVSNDNGHRNFRSGTAQAPVTIARWANETVTVSGFGIDTWDGVSVQEYIIFDGLTADGAGARHTGEHTSHNTHRS